MHKNSNPCNCRVSLPVPSSFLIYIFGAADEEDLNATLKSMLDSKPSSASSSSSSSSSSITRKKKGRGSLAAMFGVGGGSAEGESADNSSSRSSSKRIERAKIVSATPSQHSFSSSFSLSFFAAVVLGHLLSSRR